MPLAPQPRIYNVSRQTRRRVGESIVRRPGLPTLGRVWVALGVVLALALLLALALGLQGCGDSRSAGPGDVKRTFGRTSPVDPRVFRFANGAEPEVLDPALMSGQPDGRIAGALFEGLASQHPRTLDPVPGM